MTKRIVEFEVSVDNEWDGALTDLQERILQRVIAHVTAMQWDLSQVSWMSIRLGANFHHHDDKDLIVKVNRLETDDEYETRLAIEEAHKKAEKTKKKTQTEKELSELERLAKKYRKKLV